jgi:methionine sulfoxide reductase heme-binding subunit
MHVPNAESTARSFTIRDSRSTASRLKPITLIKAVAFLAALVPAIWLGIRAYRFDLTANPVTYITHFTGDWAIAFLVISLGVTPLRRLTRWNEVIKLRRMLGLFAFFYGTLHLLTWVVIDKNFDWAWMWEDISERPFITIGMGAWVMLFALALTSNRLSIRALGRRWQQLHRLVYVAAIFAVIHFWWLVKADITLPRRWAVTVAVLFGIRIWWMIRKRMSSRS